MVNVKKVAKEWKIQYEKEKVAKSKKETKKLASQKFHKQIHISGKK